MAVSRETDEERNSEAQEHLSGSHTHVREDGTVYEHMHMHVHENESVHHSHGHEQSHESTK